MRRGFVGGTSVPLLLTLAKGVLTGFGKRPAADAPLPAERPTAPAVRVDPGRVAAYARVCGFPAPGTAVPLTYPHVLGFPLAARLMARRRFPLPLLGLVHTAIEITQHRPLLPSETPGITVHARELRAHRRGVEVVVVTEARIDGAVVWEDRSTYLARTGGPAPTAAPPEARRPLPEVARWRLAADLGRRHAAVSGDWNPLHVHPLTARPLGFPRAIAHGMWTVARCAAEVVPGTARGVVLRARFAAPVLLPTTVVHAADAGAFELRSADDPSRLHLTGSVRLL
ncbi:MaoC family dehydratase [Streptomyces sp. NPDC088354]|uniref:MaoC family dehydratase n=1 Tax=Streptomyces sp. NPDC088354 TaxID=3365856 RepID=UPI003802490A